MLQVIDTVTVFVFSRDGFIHHIPSLDEHLGTLFVLTGFHHTTNPQIHGIGQSVQQFFRCLRSCTASTYRFLGIGLPRHVVEIIIVGFLQLVQVKGDGVHTFTTCLISSNCTFICELLPLGSEVIIICQHQIKNIITW